MNQVEPRYNSDNMGCPRCKSGVQTYTIKNKAHCYGCGSIVGYFGKIKNLTWEK